MSFSIAKFKKELAEAAAWAELHVAPVLHYLATGAEPHKIADAVPGGEKVIEAFGSLEKTLQVALGDVPAAQAILTAYSIYKQLGGQPMGQAGFDKLEESRGRQE